MIFGISLTNIILWLIFGFIAGWIVHVIDRKDVAGGLIGTTILGILGAIFGGWLAQMFFGFSGIGFNLTSLIVAVTGGFILSILYRTIFRKTDRIKTTTTERKEE